MKSGGEAEEGWVVNRGSWIAEGGGSHGMALAGVGIAGGGAASELAPYGDDL